MQVTELFDLLKRGVAALETLAAATSATSATTPAAEPTKRRKTSTPDATDAEPKTETKTEPKAETKKDPVAGAQVTEPSDEFKALHAKVKKLCAEFINMAEGNAVAVNAAIAATGAPRLSEVSAEKLPELLAWIEKTLAAAKAKTKAAEPDADGEDFLN